MLGPAEQPLDINEETIEVCPACNKIFKVVLLRVALGTLDDLFARYCPFCGSGLNWK